MLDHKSQTQMHDESRVCTLTRSLHAPLPEKKGPGLGFPITGDSRRGSGEAATIRQWAAASRCSEVAAGATGDGRAVGGLAVEAAQGEWLLVNL